MYDNIEYSQNRRADGFKGGRPREHDHEEIISKRREGKTLREIARETGASRSTVKRALKRHDNTQNRRTSAHGSESSAPLTYTA